MKYNARKIAHLGIMSLLVLPFLSSKVFAQEKLQGMIKGRSAGTIILDTMAQPYVNVLMEDTTEVQKKEGLLKVRKKAMSTAALIPGPARSRLRVAVTKTECSSRSP